MPTAEAERVLKGAAGDQGLGELIWRLTSQRSVLSGLATLLLVRANCPDPNEVDPARLEFGNIDGEWQPSLLRTLRYLDEHLGDDPTVSDTLRWLFDHFVVRVHQRIGYSKLPDFTFRFRWEVDRLRFYAHPFDWTNTATSERGPWCH